MVRYGNLNMDLEFPEGKCVICGEVTFHIDINICRECLRSSGQFSPITKNRKVFWNWKLKNDYLDQDEKDALRKLILEKEENKT